MALLRGLLIAGIVILSPVILVLGMTLLCVLLVLLVLGTTFLYVLLVLAVISLFCRACFCVLQEQRENRRYAREVRKLAAFVKIQAAPPLGASLEELKELHDVCLRQIWTVVVILIRWKGPKPVLPETIRKRVLSMMKVAREKHSKTPCNPWYIQKELISELYKYAKCIQET